MNILDQVMKLKEMAQQMIDVADSITKQHGNMMPKHEEEMGDEMPDEEEGSPDEEAMESPEEEASEDEAPAEGPMMGNPKSKNLTIAILAKKMKRK